MTYIGVRTSKVLPELDTTYWGSSKHLPKDVSKTHTKTIIALFFTREWAVEYEIYLHNKYDVAVNPMFYNKAKQTSKKFDTSGTTLGQEHAERARKLFLGRKHTEETKKKLSEAHKGKLKSEQAKANMSLAQKRHASSPDYVNFNKGKPFPEKAKQKLIESLKNSTHNKSTNNVKFTPWFITDTVNNVTWLFYDKTKVEYAAELGIPHSTLKSAAKHSRGHIVLGEGGYFKGKIIGNIEQAKAPQPPRRIARSWFITHPNEFTEVFYDITISEYAKEHGIKPQQISDAIIASKGIKEMKGGYFKGLILGRINKDIV
jgi:hypothetical protein